MKSPIDSHLKVGRFAGLFLAIIITVMNLSAQPDARRWHSISALGGGQINALALIGGRVFAGTKTGVYISDDDGKSWIESNSGITDTYIQCLAETDGRIYAGTLNNGVFRSDDGGRTWEKRNNGLDVPGGSESISALAVRGNSIFAGTGFGWIFVSDDLGESWRPIVEGLPRNSSYPEFYSDVEKMAVSGDYVFVATNNGGIYRLGRNETRWVAANSGLPALGISTIAAIGGTLLAGTFNSRGTYYSTDLGSNWKKSDIATVRSARSFVVLGDRIYGAFGHVASSADGGRSWQQVSEDFGAEEILAVGQTLFAGTFFDGVFQSDDRGAVWKRSSHGMRGVSVMTLASSETSLLVSFEGSAVHGSDDGGESWRSIQGNLPQPRYSSYSTQLLISRETIFASPRGAGVYRSADRGRTWTQSNNNLPAPATSPTAPSVMAFIEHDHAVYAAIYNSGVHVTFDNGESWQMRNQGMTDLRVRSLAVNGDAIFVGTGAYGSSGGMFRSLDKGQSWASVNTGLNNRAVLSIAVDGSTIYAGTERGLYISNNRGESWTKATNGLGNHEIRALAVSGNLVFAGTSGQGVFVSLDRGAGWRQMNDGFTRDNVYINALITHRNEVYAATMFEGLFRLSSQACQVELDKPHFILGSAGGALEVPIRAMGGCGWSLSEVPDWVRFTVSAGNGDGMLILTVASNPGSLARSATIDVSGKPLRVYQEGASRLTAVSAASFAGASLARGSIVSAFGLNLANHTQVAASTPLPASLGGNRVSILDSLGVERSAELFFVSPDQINFIIPDQIGAGPAIITAHSADGRRTTGIVIIENTSPSIFSAASDGRGVASAVILRVKSDGAEIYQPVSRYDSAQNRFYAEPIDMGSTDEEVYLVLFGTGIRHLGGLAELSATIAGERVEALYAGPQGSLAGLDQINIRLPRSFTGRGEVEIVITIAGKSSNPVIISFR